MSKKSNRIKRWKKKQKKDRKETIKISIQGKGIHKIVSIRV